MPDAPAAPSYTALDARSASSRALTRGDLDAVVAIDAAIEGRTRRAYFERRLGAALRQPALHVQLAIDSAEGLAGFVLARVLEGEYGRSEPSLRIEVVGVRGEAQRRGLGTLLLEGLKAWARRRGIGTIRTQARWNDHGMLAWLDRCGFSLAPNQIVDCAVELGANAAAIEAPPAVSEDRREIDYGAQSGNDFERGEHAGPEVRPMQKEDVAAVSRIDRRITGRDRTRYVEHKLAAALEESPIRMSLVAEIDGAIAGFVMARADLGDFGRTEPVAVLDTIGVDPDFAHRGAGRALIGRLFINAAALKIDRVESVVAPHDLSLLAFLYDVGFGPSQRLSFVLRLGA